MDSMSTFLFEYLPADQVEEYKNYYTRRAVGSLKKRKRDSQSDKGQKPPRKSLRIREIDGNSRSTQALQS